MEKPTFYISVTCPKTWGWSVGVKPHQHTTLLPSSASDPPTLHVRPYLTGTASCPWPFPCPAVFMPTHCFCQQTEPPSSCLHVSGTHSPLALTKKNNQRAKTLLFHLFQVHCSYRPILHDILTHFLNHCLLHLILKPCFNAASPFTCHGTPFCAVAQDLSLTSSLF